MKKLLLLITLINFAITQAQIVNIPDANFKNALLDANPNSPKIAKNVDGAWITIDINNDNQIQVSEAENVYYLNLTDRGISDLTGIEAFINITELNCAYNNLPILNLSQNSNLINLYCYYNSLSTLDISNNVDLETLNCSYNALQNINVINNTNLIDFNCDFNQLNSLDVNENINLEYLMCSNNTPIENIDLSNNPNLLLIYLDNNLNLNYINLKNGNNNNIWVDNGHNGISLFNCPELDLICVDEINSTFTDQLTATFSLSNTYTKYCSFEPQQSNTIQGIVNIDLDNNGCDTNDISLQNMLVTATNGINSFGTFIQEDSSYLLLTNDGDFTTSVTTNLPSYFTVNPNTQTNTFTGFDNTFNADFCITPNQTANDVNITLIPTSRARPGSNTTYQIVYKNIGTTQLNGDVTLEFDETKLNFLNASETVNTQTNNSVTFNYANLNPFETRTIDLEFDVLATANIDDILHFTTTINPISDDYTPNDNEFHLSQTIVDSFDPNDINILEGASIKIQNADQYLHYVIRFQNTGTANAINIVVANMLDANLDWSTLELINTSHPTRVAISNGNDIEFIFENINLPDNTTDEPNSHGFIAYKIKPKTAIAVGDIIPNKADIFFDLNEAVETNIASTTFIDEASNINDTALKHTKIYPNPVKDSFQIETKANIKTVLIYNFLGELVMKSYSKKIQTNNLSKGVYYIKIIDDNGNFTMRKIWKK